MDEIILSPVVHHALGALVVAVTLVTLVVVGVLAWRGRTLTPWARAFLILTQVVLMVQALAGIKLLDQGMGTMQLYVHYLGGLGPLFFFLLTYWFPSRSPERQTRWAALAAGGALLFAVMAYTIGGSFAAGTLS